MKQNHQEKIIWEDKCIPVAQIAKGFALLLPWIIFPLFFIFSPVFFSALFIALFLIIIFLPFIKYYLDLKLYIFIRLTDSNLYIKRTFIRKTKKFNLNEVNSIIISICDINEWMKYAPIRFNIKIITLSGEKKYKFIQAFLISKDKSWSRDWPHIETQKKRTEFKEKLNNLTDIFPKFIYVEQKAPIEKRKVNFLSYLKIEI